MERMSRRALGAALAVGAAGAAAAATAGPATSAPASWARRSPPGPNGRLYEIRRGRQRAVIAGVAASLLSWQVDGEEMLFTHPGDVLGESGYAGKTLLPWCNRIEAGRYTFGGTELQVPVNEPSRNAALHGLLNFVEWEPVRSRRDRVILRYVQPPSYGYPFHLLFTIQYTMERDGITCTLLAKNIGEVSAPYSTATHTYIAAPPGKRIDDITLTLPARGYYRTDENLIPTGKAEVAGTPYDFREPRGIGETVLDTAFADLDVVDGVSVARLERPGSVDVELWMDAGHGFYQLYTDDTPSVARPVRQGLALEPMTAAPDAFNSGDGLVVIEPGRQHVGSFGFRAA
jgi:aldose 1-epimerase